jgi:hypothetical protein
LVCEALKTFTAARCCRKRQAHQAFSSGFFVFAAGDSNALFTLFINGLVTDAIGRPSKRIG